MFTVRDNNLLKAVNLCVVIFGQFIAHFWKERKKLFRLIGDNKIDRNLSKINRRNVACAIFEWRRVANMKFAT